MASTFNQPVIIDPKTGLPAKFGVLYDREHIEGVGGFHAAPEDGGMWVECVTPSSGMFTKTMISEHGLRGEGYDVPEFSGTPCPRCFGAKEGK